MTMDMLKDELIRCVPVVQDFLKTILLKKVDVGTTSASAADAESVAKALGKMPVLIKTHDGNTGSDLMIGFEESWIPQLASAMLDMEETALNEVTKDLMKEFSAQLIGALQAVLKDEFDLSVDPEPVEIIKPAALNKLLTADRYFLADVSVNGKSGEEEGADDENTDSKLNLVVAFSLPTGEEAAGDKTDVQAENPEPEQKPDLEPESKEVIDIPKIEPSIVRESAASEKEAAKSRLRKAQKVEFDDFSSVTSENSDTEVRNLELLRDVKIQVSVELGRKELPLGDVLHLIRGSVIQLDKLAGEPVSVYANGRAIAEGEVVVIDEHFGVRITALISAKDRIEALQ